MSRLLLLLALAVCAVRAYAKDDVTLKEFLEDDEIRGDWIYEDIEAGYREAKKSGKPLLVSFSCVP